MDLIFYYCQFVDDADGLIPYILQQGIDVPHVCISINNKRGCIFVFDSIKYPSRLDSDNNVTKIGATTDDSVELKTPQVNLLNKTMAIDLTKTGTVWPDLLNSLIVNTSLPEPLSMDYCRDKIAAGKMVYTAVKNEYL